MKSTRRLLSIILCLIMCLSLLPVSAFAADDIMTAGSAGTSATFKLFKSGKLVIDGTGEIKDMEHWSFSGDYSFAADAVKATRSETKILVIGEGITDIADETFKQCPNLTAVSLPSSLLTIGDQAFYYCSGLQKITIPGNVTDIGDFAFCGCNSLVSVTLSTGLQTLGMAAFAWCSKLSSVVIPANVTTVGDFAFSSCGSLKTITFKGNYSAGLIASDTFANVEADVYYPVDNDSWNSAVPSAFDNYGGHLHWKAAAAATSSDGWVEKAGDWYYYVGGKMLLSSWKAYGGEWFYFGKDGKMATGFTQIDGDYYWFGTGGSTDPKLGAMYKGWQSGEFFGEDGKWVPAYAGVNDTGLDYYTDGWQQVNGYWFFIRNQAKVTGWLYRYGYWYYLDPTTGAMVTGWLTWNGKTYYLRPKDKAVADGIPDKEGSMIANCSTEIGGKYYSFDSSGALIGGKMDNNPLGYENGWRKEGPNWVFYRSDGKKATGWELVSSSWYYFDGNGKMLTGWQKVKGEWYYMTPSTGSGDPKTSNTGKMVTGFQTIPVTPSGVNSTRTYYFKSSGALNGKGWIKVNLKWYYLEEDGVVATGWFRDGTKWYYLRDDTTPVGEMVTGVFDVPASLKSGKANSPSGKQSFKANGEWIGAGDKSASGASYAGEWRQHDGGWYYHDANGKALTGWQEIKDKWYYLSPSSSPAGKMVYGWQTIDGNTYYFDDSGAMLAGWQKIAGVWYYLNTSHNGTYGKLMKGWLENGDDWYYLDDTTGALQDGWFEVKAGSTGEAQGFAKGWYYLNPDPDDGNYGAMQKGGWKKIDGKWYYFHTSHDGAYGRLEQGVWVKAGSDWYYVRASSNPAESWMVTGWQKIDGNWYYFDDDGVVQSGWLKWNDEWYFLHDKHDGNYGRMHTDTFGGDVEGWGFTSEGIGYKK